MTQEKPPTNLALSAKATAFEFYGDYRPERANDGNPNTRWSGIPGHNSGGWFQLDWPTPVKVAEVVVHQYGTFTEELDVQVWDDAKGEWRTLQHFGEKGQRLRGIVICRFKPVMTSKVRLGNITNGPTFREVEVYAEPYAAGKPEVHAASDLQGNIVGIVTDGWGAEPQLGSVEVRMSGRVEEKRTVRTDANGMFSVPMPVGMRGKVRFNFTPAAAGSPSTTQPSGQKAEALAAGSVPAQSATAEMDAVNFQYGLTELGYKPKVILLDGTWKFMGDPPKGFEKPGFDDSKWKDIKVPAHWEMEGFVVRSGHGGYRVRFQAPNSPSPLVGEGQRAKQAGVRGSPSPLAASAISGSPPPLVASAASKRVRGQGGGGSGRGAKSPNLHPQPLPPGHQGEGALRTKIRFEGVYSGCEVYCNGVLVARHIGGATPFEADLTDALKPGENVLALDVQEHTVASDHLDKMSIYAYFHLAGIWRSVKLFQVPEVHIRDFEWRVEDWGEKRAFVNVDIANESSREVTCLLEHELTDMKGEQLALTPGLGDRGMVFTPGLSIDALSCQRKNLRAAVRNPKLWTAETPNLYNLKLTLKDVNGKVLQTLTQRVGFRQTKVKGTEILINGTPVKFRGTCHHDQHPLKGRAVSEADTRLDLEMMKEANLNAVRTSHYPPHPSLPEIADELGLYVEDEAPFCWADASDDLRNAPLILQHTAELIARDRNHASVAWWSMANESGYGWGFWRALEWAKKADPSRPASAATSAQPGDEVGRSTAKLDIYTLHNPLALTRIQDAEGKMKVPLIFDESLCIFQGIWNDVAEMWVDPGIRDYYVEPYKEVMAAFEKSKVTQGSFIWAWSDDLFCVPNRGLEYGREATRSHFVESSYLMPGKGLVGDAPWGVVDGWRRRKPEFLHIRNLYGRTGYDTNAKFTNATKPKTNAPALKVWETGDLSGNTVHIAGEGFELGFSRDSGLLRQGVVGGKPLLLESPMLHLLPSANALAPMPDRRSWSFKGIEVKRDGRVVRVRVLGSYEGFDGQVDWTIWPESEVWVQSEFTYSGADLWVREEGLRFSVPRSSDLLRWERRADWQNYPKDHIGRPSGSAQPFANTKEGGKPTWNFAEDVSPMGSNDFRSTKRHITWGSIGYPKSSHIEIDSDGSQHLRAMVETDRISVHVNDFYGGTGAGLWEWELNYGKGRLLKKGDNIQSTLKLRLIP